MEVRRGLFVGGWTHLEEGKHRWTHVLSADGFDRTKDQTQLDIGKQVIQTLNVKILDIASENLLQHLTRCLSFIGRIMSKKAEDDKVELLVHCQAGISRSVAIVAAYIMREEKVAYDAAITSIREKHADAEPNEGFVYQLELFHRMGCRIDVSNSEYRHFLLQHKTPNFPASTAKIVREASQERETEDKDGLETLIQCRKCRSVLAKSSQELFHSPPESCKYTPGRKWRKDQHAHKSCSSVFVEPLKWMTDSVENQNEGKLCCYRCGSRIGNFSWSGIQCSCSAWVTPAFQIHRSKIDFVKYTQQAVTMPSYR